jgi:hypothetical protein
MYAVEFQAKVIDGKIVVPEQYKNTITGKVKVILLSQEILNQAEPANMIEKLLKTPIKLQTFEPFRREEIYE